MDLLEVAVLYPAFLLPLAGVYAKRSALLPKLLAAQSALFALFDLYQILGKAQGFTEWLLAFLSSFTVGVIAIPLLLHKLEQRLKPDPEQPPTWCLAAAILFAALPICVLLAPFKPFTRRIAFYAVAMLLPAPMVIHAADPVKILAALTMMSNALHPLLLDSSKLVATLSNFSILLINVVGFFVALEAEREYGSFSPKVWDRWLRS